MTRCIFLQQWFDAQSKEIDKHEKTTNVDVITGVKK
tara:strand:- start:5234 stop:5341 length:108 start_codon:yes stop_codon:yes gene_type:complete